jgi:uncharacterized iron-regulated membrane protein
MAKKQKAATRRVTRRPARRRRRRNPDATVNTLVILLVIVLVLGGLVLYAQNRKQAALFPGLTQAIAAITAPVLKALPWAGNDASDITGTVRVLRPQPAPAAGSETSPRPTSAIETPQPTSALEAPQPATVAVARTPQD